MSREYKTFKSKKQLALACNRGRSDHIEKILTYYNGSFEGNLGSFIGQAIATNYIGWFPDTEDKVIEYMVRQLINAGAPADGLYCSRTNISLAIQRHLSRVVKLLVLKGANVNTPDPCYKENIFPLHQVFEETYPLLLESKKVRNHPNDFKAFLALTKVLMLSPDLDPDVKNENGKSYIECLEDALVDLRKQNLAEKYTDDQKQIAEILNDLRRLSKQKHIKNIRLRLFKNRDYKCLSDIKIVV